MRYQNAMRLGLCQFLLMVSASVGLSFNGLLGKALAPSVAWATLPYLTMTLTTAALTLVLPKLFAVLGYARAFGFGAVLGLVGSLLAALGIWLESFVVFCAAGLPLGAYQASALYYRFAAADSVVSPPQKATAMAWVLNGGIFAALLGPLLASHSLHWFEREYLGSYLAVALLLTLALPLTRSLRLPDPKPAQRLGLSLQPVFRLPAIWAAMLFCAGSYAMMMLVMLASPLAMDHCGYSATEAASVIQWHLLGMFAPSLLTGKAIARWGALPVASVGALVLISGCGIAYQGVTLAQFHWALLLVGIGWNLMYLGGSTRVSQIADLSLRLRVQSLNEFITFALMTLTAATTGWLFAELAWAGVLLLAVGLMLMLLLAVVVDCWRAQRVQSTEQAG